MESHEYLIRFDERAELETAWSRYIKHRALATPIHPPPHTGDVAMLRVRAAWSAAEAVLHGKVVQATPAFTIFELAPLEPIAIMALVAMGLTEASSLATPPPAAATSPAADVPAPPPPAGAPPPPAAAAPAPAAAAPPSPAPPPPSASQDEPAGWDIGAGRFSAVASSVPRPEPTRSNPRIQAVRFSPHAAKAPPPGSRPAPPPPPPRHEPPTVGASMEAAGEDPRFLSALTGPARPDTEAALPAIASWGDLSESSWRDALLKLLLERATGVLVLHGFREIRWGYFVDGRPLHYVGDHPHAGEYLSDFLVREGGITQPQWTAALRMQKLTGMPAGAYLVEKGILSRDALHEALRARAARITERLVAANFGKWSMHLLPDVRFAFPYPGVDVVPLLFAVERRAAEALDDDKIVELMTPSYDHHIIQVTERLHLMKGLPFREEERTVVDDYLSGGWTIKDLLAMRAMHEKPLLRLLLVLQHLGIVQFAHEEGELAARNRVERKLFVALRNITRWPSFEALHCHWTAIQHEVEEGYQNTLAEWDPARFEALADDRIRDLNRQILQKAQELYTRLKTRAGRDELRAGTIDPSQRIMAADLLYKQSEIEIYKGNLGVTRMLFERILELVPATADGAEYREKAKEGLSRPEIGGAHYPGEGFHPVFKKLDALVTKDG